MPAPEVVNEFTTITRTLYEKKAANGQHLEHKAARTQHFCMKECLRKVAFRMRQHRTIQLVIKRVEPTPGSNGCLSQKLEQLSRIGGPLGIRGDACDSMSQTHHCCQIPHCRMRVRTQALRKELDAWCLRLLRRLTVLAWLQLGRLPLARAKAQAIWL